MSEFENDKVFWTKRMNLKLVKFIQSRPHIWNPKHSKYTSVDARDQTYREFASKFGHSFSAQAVKDRWTNIRCTFALHLRKLLAASSKNNSEEYTVNWHLWEPCQFLLKVSRKIKADPTYSNVFAGEIETANNILLEERCPKNKEYSSTEEELECDGAVNNETANESICKSLAENIKDIFRGVENDAFDIDKSKNGKIGALVVSTLQDLNSFEAAQACQKITNILLLFDQNNPINPNNFKSEH